MVKKVILTVFFAILIGVFVGFNYLLIQKEDADALIGTREQDLKTNSSIIATQADRIDTLERKNTELTEQVSTLREQDAEKSDVVSSLEANAQNREETLVRREDLISKLKQSLDVELVGQQAREWLEFIDSKDFEKAYARFNKPIDTAYSSMILSEFSAYYARQMGMVEVKSMDVMTRGVPESIDNDLVIAVVVDLITPRALELFIGELDEKRAEAEAAAEAEAEAAAEAARQEALAAAQRAEEEAAAAAAEAEAEAEAEAAANAKKTGVASGGAYETADDTDGAAGNAGEADGAARDDSAPENAVNSESDTENAAGDMAETLATSGGPAAPDGQLVKINYNNDTEVNNSFDGIFTGADAPVKNEADGVLEKPQGPEAGAEGEKTPAPVANAEDKKEPYPEAAENADIPPAPEGSDEPDDQTEPEEADPFDISLYDNASKVLEAMRMFKGEYTDEMDGSIFKTGENQFFFLLNYKKEANDWEIIKIVQKL